ncbi:MAG: LysM peptidoglycan-binding domain-containing protein [Clostridia bacterium]|nr:LysM peptidoglycan-binding domain-containing protein [Clostridia bacterium]
MLIGIDKFGKTKTFSDMDLSDETFTTMLDIEGYAFSLVYSDTAKTVPTSNLSSSQGSGTYEVQAGDTLSGIAKKLGKKRADLVQKNNLNNQDKLKIGQKIVY